MALSGEEGAWTEGPLHWKQCLNILFLGKGILNCRQIISSRFYVRIERTSSLTDRELLNTGGYTE